MSAEEIKKLRAEIANLRWELAVAHARIRDLEEGR